VAGDSDLSVWSLALGLIYRLENATITLDNAQALLLLAHKYDMRSITGACALSLSLGTLLNCLLGSFYNDCSHLHS
jgi:hypothetical protein